MKILITGATGYVGGHIGRKLESLGHELVSLTRDKNQKLSFKSKLVEPKELQSIKGVEAIVHLAGASVAGQRWSVAYKRVLRDSRIQFTKNILQNLDISNLKVHLQASATGYYSSGDDVLTEESPKGIGFLSDLVKDWEESSSHLKCRKVYLRLAMVLGEEAPAVQKMLPLFNNRIGAVLGSGKQYMSWIHIDDVVNTFVAALEDKTYTDVYNVVSPNPISNKVFTEAFGKAVDKKVILPPAPEFALKLMYGEMSQVLLDSQKAIPKKLQDADFDFKYPEIEEALKASV